MPSIESTATGKRVFILLLDSCHSLSDHLRTVRELLEKVTLIGYIAARYNSGHETAKLWSKHNAADCPPVYFSHLVTFGMATGSPTAAVSCKVANEQ